MKTATPRTVVFSFLILLAAGAASEAAAIRSGTTFAAIIAATRGTAVAYDSINHVYLVVGAHGLVQGRFVAANGTPIGAQFPIQAAGTPFAAFPRVAFSPDANGGAGGFLVTWSESDIPNNASMHGRMVAFGQNGAYGADTQLSTDGNWWEEGPYVTYSTVSREFLVVYRTFPTYIVRAVRVDNNAAARDVPFTISQTGQYEDNPSVAYNSVTNQYLVCWKGYNDPARFGFIDCKLLQAGANQVLTGPIRLQAAAATYITDTTYNPSTNQFLVTWDAGVIQGRVVNADGSLPGNVFPVSSIWHAYDALSVGYNRVSRTFFMVSHDARCLPGAPVCEDGGVELAESGVPVDNGFLVTQTGAKGAFYPTIGASSEDPNWLVTTAANFGNASVQLVAGTPGIAPVAPPAVTRNPATVVARLGTTVTFTAAASGGPAPTVQWEARAPGASTFTAISNATSPSLAVFATPAEAGKLFRAVFTNPSGSVISTAAALIVRPTLNDVDGDGRTDPLVWRPGTGTWFSLGSSSNQTGPGAGKPWGTAGDVSLTGDIDGDGISDLVVWRPSMGTWWWLTSSTNYDYGSAGVRQWGAAGDVPMLADIDGDGRSDLIVWRPSIGVWFWLTSSTGYNYGSLGLQQWGAAGDVPLTGDFDGDGKADLVVWRPSIGVFFWLTSSSGYNYNAAGQRQWGAGSAGDTPFVGDFDGDGRADLAVWRSSDGTWYWITSSTNFTYANARAVQWGRASLGDIPMLADFDGDGRSDLTVFRASTGVWYWLKSSAGYAAGASMAFGAPGDIPIVR